MNKHYFMPMSHECIVMKKSLQNHMFMLNRKTILNIVFMYHIMENIIIKDMKMKKKVIKPKDINGSCI